MPVPDAVLLDVAAPLAADLTKRLTMYKLRADVKIETTDIKVQIGQGDMAPDAFVDPRNPALGWRCYADVAEQYLDYDTIRVAHLIPESTIELIPNDSFILEMNFEALNGVDFKKGCYVGQEVTARMKHKTELRKGLVTVDVEGAAPPGTEIDAGGKPAGTLFTQSGGRGIAYLRFQRAGAEMTAGTAKIAWTQNL